MTTEFREGDQVRYVLGRTRRDKDVLAKDTATFVRHVGTDHAIIRWPENTISSPEERQVWLSRLRPAE